MTETAVNVRLRIEGHDLPGRRCGPHDDVHVGLQVGRGSTTAGAFSMFRRAKLMLDEVPSLVGDGSTVATARVHLTDEDGMPRCARLSPPALEWRAR